MERNPENGNAASRTFGNELFGVSSRARRSHEPKPPSPGMEFDIQRVHQAIPELPSGLLSETARIGILLTNKLGRVIDVNTHALEMFGYTRAELVGRAVETLLPEHLRHSHEKHRSACASQPHARHLGLGMELIARRKDGSQFPVEIGLEPLVANNEVLISCTVIDITGRKKIERQREQSQRLEAIGQLAGGVAHDFNNLLAVILGSADMAFESLPPDHPAGQKVALIRQAAMSAADLTRQLLAFSRQQLIQPRVLDLNEVISRTRDLLDRLIGKNIQIAVILEPSLGTVKADPGQIEQVILNLALNARDSMTQGGHLRIETRNIELDESYVASHEFVAPGQYVMISVQDTGCGMDRETQSRIFEPFFTTKELGKGTGLGLAVDYGIVRQSRGYVALLRSSGNTYCQMSAVPAPRFLVVAKTLDFRADPRRRRENRAAPPRNDNCGGGEDEGCQQSQDMSGFTARQAKARPSRSTSRASPKRPSPVKKPRQVHRA